MHKLMNSLIDTLLVDFQLALQDDGGIREEQSLEGYRQDQFSAAHIAMLLGYLFKEMQERRCVFLRVWQNSLVGSTLDGGKADCHPQSKETGIVMSKIEI